MHEKHFIDNILRQIPNRDKVISIEIEVGELVGIEADHLRKHLVEETGWDVTVFVKRAVVNCICGYSGSPRIIERLHDMVLYDCPECGAEPVVVEGKDIKIKKIEYKD